MRVVRPPAHGPAQLATALVSSGLAGGPGRATSSARWQATGPRRRSRRKRPGQDVLEPRSGADRPARGAPGR
jgi:hypothetical protein